MFPSFFHCSLARLVEVGADCSHYVTETYAEGGACCSQPEFCCNSRASLNSAHVIMRADGMTSSLPLVNRLPCNCMDSLAMLAALLNDEHTSWVPRLLLPLQVDKPYAKPYVLRGHDREVTAVAWCPTDPHSIATCGDDATVKLWSVQRPWPPVPRSAPQVGLAQKPRQPALLCCKMRDSEPLQSTYNFSSL